MAKEVSEQQKRFDRIWAEVDDGFPPVRPLGPPWRRSLPLALWSLLSLGCVLVLFGLREDCSTLGIGLSWVPSLVALALAYLLFVFAGRESVPGSGVGAWSAVLWAVAACVIHVAISHFTYLRSPTVLSDEHASQTHLMCIVATLVIGAPLVLMGVGIARSGLLIRPWVAGLLTGVSAGVVADAVWRLHCPYSGPEHFLLAHTCPYAALIVLGLCFLKRRRRG